jgi:hypothetical protein
MNMRFWKSSILLHFGFFVAFFCLKPDFTLSDLQEKINGDVIIVDFVYEPLVEENNTLPKPIEASKQTAAKSLRGQVRTVSPKKVLPKPAQGPIKVAAARTPESSKQTVTKMLKTNKVNSKKYQPVAPRVSALSGSAVIAAAMPIKSSDFKAHSFKTCTSKSSVKPSIKQDEIQANKQITITNLVGLHPAHRALLQGQAASISTLLGARRRGSNVKIATLLDGSQNQNTQTSCK